MSKSSFLITLSCSLKRSLPLILLPVLMAVIAQGQTTSSYDGKTPSGLAPGAPAGSYPLSGFDNINLYNGRGFSENPPPCEEGFR